MPIGATSNSRSDEFAGKVAFITGAGSGIGRATALAFADRGAAVAIADVSAEASRGVAEEIIRTGGQALGLTCDVTVSSDVQTALRQTVEAFGRLDYAFNNAGIEQAPTPLADITEDQWQRVLDIDLRGVFLCMKYEIPLILAAGKGAIINTSSGAGVKGFSGGGAYGAAKHGVIGLTRCAALDYASANLRINAICPGIIETPMMDRFSGGTPEGRERVIDQEPVGRMGRPEEIASAVMWLCSDNAAFTVGHALVVDGGQTVG
jgi:NAD(P)-dependent dehydrogenase (short-subunit alcohol dehydrogenase family)